jgi:O-antigen biosynthesis protein
MTSSEKFKINEMEQRVDIIIPFHNGLNRVIDCLDSVFGCTRPESFTLFLIDDNSDHYTYNYLRKWFEDKDHVSVFKNTGQPGYLKSANWGIGLGTAPSIVLMHSGVVVTPGWLDRLMACAKTDDSIAVVMPLTNTAPLIGLPLAPGVSFMRMDEYVRRHFPGKFSDVLISGGCLLLQRNLLDKTGLFDDMYHTEEFGESDLCMRLKAGGCRKVAACDVYVYQNGKTRLTELSDAYHRDQAIFKARWGNAYQRQFQEVRQADPLKSVREVLDSETRWDPMPVIWSTARVMLNRIREGRWIKAGIDGFRGALKLPMARRRLPSSVFRKNPGISRRLRVTYILHNLVVAGGVLSVIQIVNELTLLGVDARMVTLFKDPAVADWTRLYSEPIVFGNQQELLKYFPQTDIVVATLWTTASLADQLVRQGKAAKAAYFIQDYEPWFFPESDRVSRNKVRQTYAMIPDRIVKSRWLADMLANEGHGSHQIWLGMDLGVFYPRDVDRTHPVVMAMARPQTHQRGFPSTIEALANVKRQMPDVEIVLFGDRFLRRLSIPFDFRDEGVVTNQTRMAELYSEATVFLDGSDFQGFGRCGLEAMACGAACVLTGAGGVTEYAVHDYNSLIVPPKSPDLFSKAILSLLRDQPLRNRLMAGGMQTAKGFCHKREARETLEFMNNLTTLTACEAVLSVD